MAELWNESKDLIQGNKLNLYLSQDKKVVAYGTNASVQIDTETLDTSSKFACRWSSAIGGKSNYTINSDSLYTATSGACSFDQFVEWMVAGSQIEWYLGQEVCYSGSCSENPHTLDTTKAYYNGKGIITSCSLECGMDDAASCSITITGAGPIEKNEAQIQTGNPCEDND